MQGEHVELVASPCISSFEERCFCTLSLSLLLLQNASPMPHLWEKKLAMHIGLQEPILLLHFAIGVSLRK
jgi:hypothetical protein